MNRKYYQLLILLTALIFSLPKTLLAQDANAQEAFLCPDTSRSAPGDVLSRVQKNYDNVSFFSATFTQYSYLFALDTQESSSGTVWFQKPGNMKWLYLQPEEQEFLFRNNTFWYYQAYDKQLFIDEMKGAFQSDLPLSFLMGIGSLHEQFEIRASCKKGTNYSLRLKPKNKDAEDKLSDFYLLVSESSYFPQGAMTVDISQNSTAIRLTSISQKEPDDVAAIFKADFPDGIDIQDNRNKDVS